MSEMIHAKQMGKTKKCIFFNYNCNSVMTQVCIHYLSFIRNNAAYIY